MSRYVRFLAIKAARTFAQTLAGVLTANGTGLLDTDWRGALSASGMAALVAVLMNVGDAGGTSPDEGPGGAGAP